MGLIFKEIDKFSSGKKNFFMLAHSDEVQRPDGRSYYKLKTTGRMVDEYVTPEGKFDVVLVGHSNWDASEKKVRKYYITNEDEMCASAKSPIGLFDELYITNDLGYVANKINKFNNN